MNRLKTDVIFDIYEKSYKSGETVVLSTNSTNYTVVNYTVFVKEDAEEVVTSATTTATPVTTTTMTTTDDKTETTTKKPS